MVVDGDDDRWMTMTIEVGGGLGVVADRSAWEVGDGDDVKRRVRAAS